MELVKKGRGGTDPGYQGRKAGNGFSARSVARMILKKITMSSLSWDRCYEIASLRSQ
jgi:hypothetical protein